MGKTFYFRRNPLAANAEKVEMEEFGETQMLRERVVTDPVTGQEIGRRLAAAPQALDPEDNMTYKGDRLIPRGEEHQESDGTITQIVERVDGTGRTVGTYEMTWERTGERQMTHTRSRRIFS